MNFKEWHAKQKFFPDEYHEELMRFAWKSAQEDMRERAAMVCHDYSSSEDGHSPEAEFCEIAIRNLPIEA